MNYDDLRLEYETYVCESRACGSEVLSFEEWSGEASYSAREIAEDRWLRLEREDNLDLY